MGALDVLYDPITNKYFIDLGLALITIFLNIISNHLNGSEYLYRVSHILTGAINWTVFTVYLTLFIPHYVGDVDKLTVFSFVIIIFWLLVVGCWVAKTLGQGWKAHETISRVALTGSPLVLAILSLIIFVFFDFFFWVISPYL